MKKLIVLGFAAVVFLACKDTAKEETSKTSDAGMTEMAEEKMTVKTYPDHMAAIFKAHGGIDNWNKMNSLQFKFEGRGGTEMNTVSLKDRRSLIETEGWAIGNDGTNVWLQNKEGEYGGNARFYHNLYFYFYAMPFIVGDDGITYTEVEATELPNGTFPGVKISYDSGIGDSPDDEYVIYYNPDTHTMEWLAYTVTFGKNEKNQNFNFIKYDEWNEVSGLTLPRKLVWYAVEDGKPTLERSPMEIETLSITENVMADATYTMPEGAEVIEK